MNQLMRDYVRRANYQHELFDLEQRRRDGIYLLLVGLALSAGLAWLAFRVLSS